MLKRLLSILLITALLALIPWLPARQFAVPAMAGELPDSTDEAFEEALLELREFFSETEAAEASDLDVIGIDMGRIIHKPQEYPEPESGSVPEPALESASEIELELMPETGSEPESESENPVASEPESDEEPDGEPERETEPDEDPGPKAEPDEESGEGQEIAPEPEQQESIFAPLAEQLPSHPGPFAIGDTRDFRADVSPSSPSERIIKGVLVGQGAHTNVWVLDDADYHAKRGTTHNDATCHLNKISGAIAQGIADDFDAIYNRMTADYGGHAGFNVNTGWSNIPQVGDLGEDGKINFLLYDIGGDGGGTGGYIAGFFNSGDYFTYYNDGLSLRPAGWTHPSGANSSSSFMNNLDMMHIDIGHNQGYRAFAPGASEADKLSVYGTLAHEFQHLLFYIHFGVYFTGNLSSRFLWFNESLSELAATFYVWDDTEIADINRLLYAAGNSYSGYNYGDFLNFNNSMKNYGMGKLFSMLMYKTYGSSYMQGVYGKMAAEFPPANNSSQRTANESKIATAGHDGIMNSLLHFATGAGSGTDTLPLLYYLFMENFAADGGIVYGGDTPAESTKFYTATNPVDNLWAIRPVLGIPNGVVRTAHTGGGVYNVSAQTPIPTYSPGGAITLSGYGSSNSAGASHEMLYKLTGGSIATPYLHIAAPNDGNPSVRYYAVVAKETTTTSGGYTSATGLPGADVYPLTKGEQAYIDTSGMPAYLFVSTLQQNVSSTVTYSWAATMPVIVPFTGLYGDANGDGRVNGTDVQALILWINAGRPAGRINEEAAKIADEGIYNPRPHLNSVQELVMWINAGGAASVGHPGPSPPG